RGAAPAGMKGGLDLGARKRLLERVHNPADDGGEVGQWAGLHVDDKRRRAILDFGPSAVEFGGPPFIVAQERVAAALLASGNNTIGAETFIDSQLHGLGGCKNVSDVAALDCELTACIQRQRHVTSAVGPQLAKGIE